MSIAELTTFLGWCTVVNMGLLVLMAVLLAVLGPFVKSIHSRLYNISEERLDVLYFDYLGRYKGMLLVFNFAPYCALKIMA